MKRNVRHQATTVLAMPRRSSGGRSRVSSQGRRRGFTLIELLLVMVILLVLAGLVVPKFTNRTKEAKNTAARTDISNLSTALDAFEVDNGRYPTNDEGLNSLVNFASTGSSEARSYINKIPVDPWGNSYIYQNPGSHNALGFDLSSYGPDGREGGGDDLTNW